MKKLVMFLVVAFIFIFNKNASAQTDSTMSDTIAYIQQIVANKEKYIGKSFSVLAKDLKLPVMSSCGAIGKYLNREESTVFFFRKIVTFPDIWIPSHGLSIYWQPPYNDLFLPLRLSPSGNWNDKTDSLYNSGKYIIADIDEYGKYWK